MFRWISNLLFGRRAAGNSVMEWLRGRYDAAGNGADNRRHWQGADALSANTANSPEVRAKLRERSRFEFANNGYCNGLVLTIADYLVGTGPTLQVIADAEIADPVEKAFGQWCEAVGLAEKLHTATQAKTRDGEAFLKFFRNPTIADKLNELQDAIGPNVDLDIQVIECDMVATPNFSTSPNPVDGMDLDSSGNPVFYHLLKEHPGEITNSFRTTQDFDRINANEMIHWFRADRPGQYRGVPEITPSLPLFAMLRRWTLASVAAAEIGACFAAVLESDAVADDGTGEVKEGKGFETMEVERAMLTALPPGAKLNQLEAKHPAGSYPAGKAEILKEIGRPTGMPRNVLEGDSSFANYSSARLDGLNFRAAIKVRREHCRRNVLERIFAAWLNVAREFRTLGLSKLTMADLPHAWYWPGQVILDSDVVQANIDRVNNFHATDAEICAEEGKDWQAVYRQRAKELALRKELGLPDPPQSGQPMPTDTQNANDQTQPNQQTGQQNANAGWRGREVAPSVNIAAAAQPSEFKICGTGEPLEIQAAEGDGKLPTFSIVAYTGGAMSLQGFYLPVVVDLEGATAPRQNNPVLRDHDLSRIIGHTTSVEISQQRIKASGVVSAGNEHSGEIVALAKNGFPWQASIGAKSTRMERVDAGEKVKVNGKTFTGPLLVARGAILKEISFVALGADANSSASVAARNKGNDMTEFEKWLTAKGIDHANLQEHARVALLAAYEAEKAPKPPTTPVVPAVTPPVVPPIAAKAEVPFTARMEAIEAEERRVEQIREITLAACERNHGNPDAIKKFRDLCAAAEEDKTTTVKEFQHAIQAADRYNHGPLILATGKGKKEITDEILEAAVAQSCNVPNLDKRYGEQALQAAHKRFPRGIGLKELLLVAGEKNNGYRGSLNDEQALCRAAFRPAGHDRGIVASDVSSINVPVILSNVANKSLEDGFGFGEQTWRLVAKIGNLKDFKQASSARLDSDLIFKPLAQSGQIQHGKLSEESYTIQLNTYAIALGIDRKDLINDDLGAFNGASTQMGFGAIKKLNSVFWSDTWLAGQSAYFPTSDANDNYISGASTPLSIAGLNLADVKFMLQTGADGEPIGLMPSVLLVPAALGNTAAQLMTSTGLVVGTTPASGPANNVFSGRYSVAVSRYLDAASSIEWWLLADPRAVAAIQVAFLNGVDRPTVQTSEFDFDKLGLSMRGYFDFGCSMMEYRAGVRSKGTA